MNYNVVFQSIGHTLALCLNQRVVSVVGQTYRRNATPPVTVRTPVAIKATISGRAVPHLVPQTHRDDDGTILGHQRSY